MSIADLFRELKDNPSGHAFTVAPIPGRDNLLLGVDVAAHPCLFVRADERSMEPPLRTAHVSLQLSQQYTLAGVGESPRSELLHALRCEAPEAVEVDTFLVLVEAFLMRHQDEPIDQDTLNSFFRSMVRLFSTSPARDLQGERQGLWGELFIMRRVCGFRFWSPFWHSEVTRLFDFSAPGKRVEVKTTIGGQRIHHFSHRQVYALEGEEIVIASLILREDDVGLSLRELISECRADLLDTPDYLKLERAVRRAGMEGNLQPGPIFDAVEAKRDLAWFRSTDAPHFRMAEPTGVSETRYKVDLSMAPRIHLDELEGWLDTWPAVPAELAGARREW